MCAASGRTAKPGGKNTTASVTLALPQVYVLEERPTEMQANRGIGLWPCVLVLNAAAQDGALFHVCRSTTLTCDV